MLAGQAGEAELPLGAVAVPAVQPGQLRDRQLRPLAGNGQEAQMAVAQNKVIELTQEKIADAVGFQAFAAVIGLNGVLV
jgi:hypothetical protein